MLRDTHCYIYIYKYIYIASLGRAIGTASCALSSHDLLSNDYWHQASSIRNLCVVYSGGNRPSPAGLEVLAQALQGDRPVSRAFLRFGRLVLCDEVEFWWELNGMGRGTCGCQLRHTGMGWGSLLLSSALRVCVNSSHAL
jgi:hypothetical protein